ncbi:MAG: GerAB/ArcD/ProY family transporter [Clostridia bacterium]|nr:GerAB/ArcD/ProY family transporter [Clostridia bacterium]
METENKRSTVLYNVSLIAAFSLANGLIAAPFSKDSLLPYFAALGGALCLAAVLAALLGRFKARNINPFLTKILCVVIAAASFAAALFSLKEYCGFIYDTVLYRSGMISIKAIFAFCVFYFAVSGSGAVYKFSLFSAVAVSVILPLLFFMSLKTFDIKNLSGVFSFGDTFLKDSENYFLRMFLPTLPAVGYIAVFGKKISPGGAAGGVILGAALSLIVLFDTVLSFGLPLSAKLDYPYIGDISTVTVGNLFTRMDGFAYIAFFVCHLIKCGVSIKLAALLLSKAGIKNKKITAGIMSAAAIFL